ncbi:PucR family transcriptional regulator [Streptomyces sp. NPDC020917]|uniref:PucR family transcriptional regulator n=1 Tax=Streptomyces sp. NPDC020917 TaxID=3365102 RepID=UPI0037A8F6D7
MALDAEGSGTGDEAPLRLSAPEKARLREIAEQIRFRADSLADKLILAYRAEIPQYAVVTDPVLLADMKAVSLTGLLCWLDALDVDRPIDDDLLLPVLEARSRRALQGVGMDAMLRAYRIATRTVWQEILELPVDQKLMAPLSRRMLEFVDRLTTAAESAYAAETPEIDPHHEEQGHPALFEAVLAGQHQEQHREAGELASDHCVVLVEVLRSTTRLSLDELAAGLAHESRAAYWTTRHRSVVAACPVGRGGGRDELLRRLERFARSRPSVDGVAVGGAARGTAETRQSYREAGQALQIGAQLGDTATRVHDYQQLAPLAALIADREQARRYVQGCLAPLGRLAERGWVLPTLASYLRRQGRLKAVAADLGVHHSTVKYRLNELRPFLDAHAQDGDRAGAVLLAIRVHDYLAAEQDPVPGGRTGAGNSVPEDEADTRTTG